MTWAPGLGPFTHENKITVSGTQEMTGAERELKGLSSPMLSLLWMGSTGPERWHDCPPGGQQAAGHLAAQAYGAQQRKSHWVPPPTFSDTGWGGVWKDEKYTTVPSMRSPLWRSGTHSLWAYHLESINLVASLLLDPVPSLREDTTNLLSMSNCDYLVEERSQTSSGRHFLLLFIHFFDGIEVLFPTYVKAESQLGPSMPHFGLGVAARCVSSRGGREEGSQNNALLFYRSSYNANYRAWHGMGARFWQRWASCTLSSVWVTYWNSLGAFQLGLWVKYTGYSGTGSVCLEIWKQEGGTSLLVILPLAEKRQLTNGRLIVLQTH